MKHRDDMEIFTEEYKGFTFQFRLPDYAFKPNFNREYNNFIVPVWEKNQKMEEFTITFRVKTEELDFCRKEAKKEIIKKVNSITGD